MKFQYKSKSKTGETIEGVIEAPDKFAAAKQLRDQGEIPITVKEKSVVAKFNISLDGIFGGIKLHEKILLARNLSGMLTAGLSLYRAIEVLRKQAKKPEMIKVLDTLLKEIDAGGTLSSGMQKFPKVFSNLFVFMVKAGEESGGLPANLKEVAGHLEKAYNLTKKIKGALTYPLIILSAIGLVGVLMMIFVVPTLIKTFQEVGADLPASTKLIIGLSNFLSQHTILFVLCVLAFGVGVYFIFKIKKVSEVFDSVILKLPVIGVIAKEMNSARTTRTLGSLLSSGVDISRAITITRDVLQSHPYKLLLEEARLKVEKGAPLSSIIKGNTNLYPVMVGEMMEVGEETGKLTDMLHDIATFYEDEVDAKTKDLSTVIEPMLMIFIGAAVGFFAISMISPMYSLVDNIK